MIKNLLLISIIIVILIINLGIIIYGLMKKKKERYEFKDDLKQTTEELLSTLPQDVQDFLKETNLQKKDQMMEKLSRKYDLKTMLKLFGDFFGSAIINALIKSKLG